MRGTVSITVKPLRGSTMEKSAKKKRGEVTASRFCDAEGIRAVDHGALIPRPQLRAKLGISAVTLWRWRHDDESDFPSPKVINGRLYFSLCAISAWIAKQPEA